MKGIDLFEKYINNIAEGLISIPCREWESLVLNVQLFHDSISYQLKSKFENDLEEVLDIPDEVCDIIEDSIEKILKTSTQHAKKKWNSVKIEVGKDNKFSINFSD